MPMPAYFSNRPRLPSLIVVSNALQKIDPATQVLDIATSSIPSNPLCWAFVSIEMMNTRSGSADKSAVRTAIDTILRADGRNVELLLARRPRDLPMLARRAADSRPGILLAAGGDGTLNAVASIAHARGLPFAVMPLGTFNYFAQNLGIPLDSASAARVITEGCVRRVAIV